MNRIKLVVSILTCISTISVYPVQKKLTARQIRLMGMAARVKKENTAKLEQLLKKDLTRMTEAEYKTWKSETDQATKALQKIDPKIATPYQKTIENLVAANEIKASLAKINNDIEDEKNKEIADFNKFDGLLRNISEEIAKIQDTDIRKNITRVGIDTIKKLANTTYTYVTKKLNNDNFKDKGIIDKTIGDIFSWAQNKDKTKLTQNDGYNKLHNKLEQIRKTTPKIFENKDLILYRKNYFKRADEKIKQELSEKISSSVYRLHGLYYGWQLYIDYVFLKKPDLDDAKEKTIVTQAIDRTALMIINFADEMITKNASLFGSEQLKKMKDENDRDKQLLETLEKRFKKTYNQTP